MRRPARREARGWLSAIVAVLAAVGCTRTPEAGPRNAPATEPAAEPGSARPAAAEPAAGSTAPTGDAFAPAALRAAVEHLASPELAGRGTGTPGNRAAAQWIAERFEALGLEPAVNGGWFDEFKLAGLECRNVAGIVRGPSTAKEYVVVGCHHDHLGTVRDRVFRGADDNASGCAAMLALAAYFVAHRAELARHMVFVSYDAEEKGLIGSRMFVDHDVIPIESTVFMLVFDLIGGTLLPGEESRFYVIGSEHSQAVRKILDGLPRRETIEARALGTYLIEPAGPLFARSDYAAYRAKQVPYLFLTTATPWYYHTPQDTPDRLDYAKMSAAVRFARDVLREVAMTEVRLDYIKGPPPEAADLEAVMQMLRQILDRAEELRVPANRAEALRARLEALEAVLASGNLGNAARRRAQEAIVDILGVAKRYRPAK